MHFRHCLFPVFALLILVWICFISGWLSETFEGPSPEDLDDDYVLLHHDATTTHTEHTEKFYPQEEGPVAWILQADSQPLRRDPYGIRVANTTNWMNLMASVNLNYARRHGYGYIRFLFANGTTCNHVSLGSRHIAWCKLLVIAHLMQWVPPTVQYLVWIDSDAMIQHQHWTIQDILDSVPSGCLKQNECNTDACRLHRQSAALVTTANEPFCGEPALTAFQVWNLHSNISRLILMDWWNSNLCANQHPWEQRAFVRDVYHKYALDERGGIAILRQDVNHPNFPERKLKEQFLRHVGHFVTLNGAGARLPHAKKVAHNVGLDGTKYRETQDRLHTSHHQSILTQSDLDRLSRSLWDGQWRNASDCKYVVNPVLHPKR